MNVPEIPEDLGAAMGPEVMSSLRESCPSPPLSYLSMESDEEEPVKADEEQGFSRERVRFEAAESSVMRQSEYEKSSVMPSEGAFISGHGGPVEKAESATMRQNEYETSRVGSREGAFLPRHGTVAPNQSVSDMDLLHELNTMAPEKEDDLSPMEMPFIFKSIQKTLQQLTEEELSLFKKHLRYYYSEYFENKMEDLDVLDVVDKMLERCGKVVAVKAALCVLKHMKRIDLAEYLEAKGRRVLLQHDLRESYKKKYTTIFEGIPRHGQFCHMNRIYTEVHMTEGGIGEVNDDHEVRQGETASGRRSRPEVALKPSDLFDPSFSPERRIRTVMTRGIAGIGLTVTVKKFMMDWIMGKSNQDIHFIFPLSVHRLNLAKSKEYSLIDFLAKFYPKIKSMDFIESPDCKVLFVFDAFDECQLNLNFQKNGIWNDPKAPTSVDMLLTNLIRGNLLPSCYIWITSRTAASSIIPEKHIDLLTQLHGFTDSQKDEYFMKKIQDQSIASKILEHVKSTESLYVMAHVPVFSWILVTALEDQMTTEGPEATPILMTQLFTHYVLLQSNAMHTKYQGYQSAAPEWTKDDRDLFMKLGKLGFQLLEKGSKEFCLRDLRECGLDDKTAIVQSGLCTELFPPRAQPQQRVFSFVHLCIQEYLAAFYVYMLFRVDHKSAFDQARVRLPSWKEITLVDLLVSAVDKALQSESGHFDLFLRFLLGLSVDSSQRLFRPFITLPENVSPSIEEVARYIRKKIQENASPDRCRSLRRCLTEMEE